MNLWNNNTEIVFFKEALKNFASPEQLFYKLKDGYYAYIPKNYDSEGQTLQSRNALIGRFTEKWCKNLFEPIAKELGLFALNGVICKEVGITKQSPADLVFCLTNEINQKPENIKVIFEIKMSIISNYKFIPQNKIEFIGDYKQHKGNPSLLRSDSMLKAIGKAINIRVANYLSSKIPIIVLGNSPITKNYVEKVDFLKKSGVIQGFWSLNPEPTNTEFIKNTKSFGFQTMFSFEQLLNECKKIIDGDMNYFSSMIPMKKLGEIIRIANQEIEDVKKAEKFLTLIREYNE